MHATAPLSPGTVLGGEYRILKPLGGGGMGAVYLAEQLSTGRSRALKVMHPQLVPDVKSRERFAEEARVGARIPSEHIVEVVGAGVDAATGLPFLAMELLEGEELAQVIEREGPLPVPVVKELMLQTGHALAAAHQLGVVHRDLKPENLFVSRSRRRGAELMVKILDFGIAKTMQESRSQVTSTSAIGSPLFMAPEQGSPGAQLSAATDVWALGLIAFYALTGKMYWRSANTESAGLQALLSEVLVYPIEPASTRAAALGSGVALPPGFDGWFVRCVDRDAAQRFPDAGACIAALERVLGGGVGAGPMAVGATLAALPGSSRAPGVDTRPGYTVPMPAGQTPYAGGPFGSPSAGAGPAPFAPAPLPPLAQAVSVRRGQSGALLAIVALVLGAGVVVVAAAAAIFLAAPAPVTVAAADPGAAQPVAPEVPVAPTGPASLRIESQPSATVQLDGRTIGVTPLSLEVAPGLHTLTFTSQDGRTETRAISLEPGARLELSHVFPDAAPAAPGVAPRSRDDLQRVMAQHRGELQRCYEREIRGQASPPSVRVVLSLAIAPSGEVTEATTAGAEALPGLGSCVVTAARRWEFPAASDVTRVNYPFNFTSDDGEAPAPTPERAPSALPQTPGRGDVVAALSAVQPAVSACGDGTHGLAPVRIEFEGSGRVVSATVTGGSFSPAVQGCVARAVRGARVPPFSQPSFGVNYPFRI